MGKYGEVAIKAIELMQADPTISPKSAWKKVVAQAYPDSDYSQEKDCPRCAFLGLCEEGMVNGVDPGNYTRSYKNKQYAIDAVRLLTSYPSLANDAKLLWDRVMKGDPKTPNYQMEVVIALWKEGLINPSMA